MNKNQNFDKDYQLLKSLQSNPCFSMAFRNAIHIALQCMDYTKAVINLPTCDTCKFKSTCKNKPELGEWYRINCFKYKEEE